MKQYLELAKAVKEKGTYKAPAREGMPGTTSLFGYQFRHDLSEGFPLLTTKKLSFKNIVVELLWFLRGDTNIKYLIDNGCNIWNEDSYNYYVKKGNQSHTLMSFEEFIGRIKKGGAYVENHLPYSDSKYILGDCGKQYGWLWRRWETGRTLVVGHNGSHNEFGQEVIDQIKELIDGLKNSPMGRRHIISAWNPSTLNDMALNACHALVQFNCRPLSYDERNTIHTERYGETVEEMDARWEMPATTSYEQDLDNCKIPKYKLDCQMYQRSADLFLGVPYNIASYGLLTHIVCKICNMVPGDFIHSFGDVHIYDNHMAQIDEQLTREPKELPQLICLERNEKGFLPDNLDKYFSGRYDLNDFIESLQVDEFRLKGYDPHPTIKGELSTGLKK